MRGERLPLHGTKTHPLTVHSLAALRNLTDRPVPAQEINAGVVNRLLREALAEIVMLPSPYKTRRGERAQHLRITEAGRAALRARAPAAGSAAP